MNYKAPVNDDEFRKIVVFIATVFAGCSLSGWAKMLWEGKKIPRSRKLGGVLMSGAAGVIVALLLWDHLLDRPALLAGVSMVAGIGGASTIEWLTQILPSVVGKFLPEFKKDDDHK